ncbi:hypothetical protein SprV_0501987800 [Sparganum proliferum]
MHMRRYQKRVSGDDDDDDDDDGGGGGAGAGAGAGDDGDDDDDAAAADGDDDDDNNNNNNNDSSTDHIRRFTLQHGGRRDSDKRVDWFIIVVDLPCLYHTLFPHPLESDVKTESRTPKAGSSALSELS